MRGVQFECKAHSYQGNSNAAHGRCEAPSALLLNVNPSSCSRAASGAVFGRVAIVSTVSHVFALPSSSKSGLLCWHPGPQP